MTQKSRYSASGLPAQTRIIGSKSAFTGFTYTGTLSFTMTPESDIDPDYTYSGTVSFTLKAPDTGVVVFTHGVAYAVMASVFIDGEDYTSSIQGTVNVTRENNAAATFNFTINETTKKPAEHINKEVIIAFQAADSAGIVVDYIPIFKGIVKRVVFNESIQGALTLSGYDYGGVHGSPGEFISKDVMTVLTGSVMITGTGTYNVGFSPIWGVAYNGTDDIEDGRDYFVDTLNGEIIIPLSSNFNSIPGELSFKYADPFASLKALIENIAAEKSWLIEEDGVTIVDYTSITKQPIISLSNESVIDVIRKFLELTGAKAESNLFPDLRVYSETVNLTGADNHMIDESIYYEDSLNIDLNFEDLITEQTVRSVAKTYANIEIGATETLADKSGTLPIEIIYDVIVWGDIYITGLVAKTLVEVRISKTNIFSVSHTAGGTFDTLGTITNIQDSDWTQTIEDNEIVFKLTVLPVITFLFARVIVSYPKLDWTLLIEGTKINYGDGTIEQTVEVTGSRPVTGISDTLVGDVYENPFIETAAHAGNIANAILTEAGNTYRMSCELPLHKAKTMKIGDKINVERSGTAIFKGIIKMLDYNINTESAESPVGIEARGVGVGI